ncbi:MAG: hypothetical protein WKF71_14180 [Pyrinomonadaceae bacterium]
MIANAANTLPQMRGMMYKGAIDEAVKSGTHRKGARSFESNASGQRTRRRACVS